MLAVATMNACINGSITFPEFSTEAHGSKGFGLCKTDVKHDGRISRGREKNTFAEHRFPDMIFSTFLTFSNVFDGALCVEKFRPM